MATGKGGKSGDGDDGDDRFGGFFREFWPAPRFCLCANGQAGLEGFRACLRVSDDFGPTILAGFGFRFWLL